MDNSLEYDGERSSPIDRVRDLVEDSRLDIGALIWMVCLGVIVAVGIQSALDQGFGDITGQSDTWIKVAQLSRVGGLGLAVAVLVGLAVAAAVPTRPARIAAALGVILGAWLVVAAGCGIAFELWAPDNTAGFSLGTSTWSAVLMGLAELAMGVIVAVGAWRVASYVRSFELVEEEPQPPIVS